MNAARAASARWRYPPISTRRRPLWDAGDGSTFGWIGKAASTAPQGQCKAIGSDLGHLPLTSAAMEVSDQAAREGAEMDGGYISAISALAGSAIGALASLATTWLTQHSQMLATRRLQDRARREAIYGDFIREASRLFADAFEHGLDDPAKLVALYATVGTIRLFGRPRTIEEAERVMNQIGAAYFAPNKELQMFADITREGELDPLCAFSEACRDELSLTRI